MSRSCAPRCRSSCPKWTSCSAISKTRFRPTPRRRRATASSPWRSEIDFGATGLWTRINALNSPWALDDLTADRRRGRQQARRRHAAQGRRRLGHPLSRPTARAARGEARRRKADPDPRHPGDRGRRQQCRGDRGRVAAHARHEPRSGRSCGLARDEDDARRRRPSRLQGARRIASPAAPAHRLSRICGTTRSARWSTPARRPASSRSTVRSATSPIPKPARRSSATPS